MCRALHNIALLPQVRAVLCHAWSWPARAHSLRARNGISKRGVIHVAAQPWTLNQLLKLRRYQPERVDCAVEEMLEQQADLRWSVVVGAYLDGEINLSKAAELLGMHRLELQESFIAQGIPLRIVPESTEEARPELGAIEAWNAEAEGASRP